MVYLSNMSDNNQFISVNLLQIQPHFLHLIKSHIIYFGGTQVVAEIPYVFVQTAYYSLIVYALVSFQWTAAKFFWFFFVSFFSFLYFTYYGMMTVSITPNHQVASIFAAAFYAVFNLFSGFFIPRPVSSFSSVA